MSLAGYLLRPLARLAGAHAHGQAKAFLAAHQRTAAVQQRLLEELLGRHSDTAFGRDHGFARLRSYEEFARAVPIARYERFEPYIARVLAGETTALLPPGQDVVMFSLTSGTTGRCKHIPVTPRFVDELRRGWNIWGLTMLRQHERAWLRGILQISSPMRESDSPAGKCCGAVSGLLAASQKRIVRRMYVVPPEVPGIADAAARYYVTLRCGVGRDVAVITTANPSSTIRLIEVGQQHAQRLIRDVRDGTLSPPGEIDAALARRLRFRPNAALADRMERGVERDGELRPGHFWSVEVLANWTGGTLGLYLPRLRKLFDGAPVRDVGLLASEGRFTIPLSDETPAGPAEILGNFLEFLPDGSPESAGPAALRAHEVEVGREYSLVFSNWTGLFRYNLDDRVRVVDRLGETPVLEFLHRGSGTANITGEKLTERQVVEAMSRARAVVGAAVERFVLGGRFASEPYYRLELDGLSAETADRLAAALDDALAELNIEYASKRHSGRLGAIRVNLLPAGELERAEREGIARRRGRAEQYKHQYLKTEVVRDDPPVA